MKLKYLEGGSAMEDKFWFVDFRLKGYRDAKLVKARTKQEAEYKLKEEMPEAEIINVEEWSDKSEQAR